MLEITAWTLVVGSYLMLGVFGYAAVTRSTMGMILGAVVLAFVLSLIASQFFMVVEIRTIQRLGSIQEDQIQPDMPNLMAGLILYGWAFFLCGFFVGWNRKQRRVRRHS